MQEASATGECAQSFMERGVPYATEPAQLTERYWTAGGFERGGDAIVDGERGGERFVRPLEYNERESGVVLLEFECEGGR
ncbi:MAG: hypothetical protein ACRES6_09295 [Steroidobacteraceae bacterium]